MIERFQSADNKCSKEEAGRGKDVQFESPLLLVPPPISLKSPPPASLLLPPCFVPPSPPQSEFMKKFGSLALLSSNLLIHRSKKFAGTDTYSPLTRPPPMKDVMKL